MSRGGRMGAVHPVISPQKLAELLSGLEPPTVADVRWSLTGPPGRVDYNAGHLPGAVFVDVDADLAGPPGTSGRHPLPYPAALQAALRAAGVGVAGLQEHQPTFDEVFTGLVERQRARTENGAARNGGEEPARG